MANLDGLSSTTCSRSVRLKLSLNTSVQSPKQVSCAIYRFADGQDTVVLENHSLLVSKCFSNPTTFFVGKDDAAKVIIDGVVFVESTCILIDWL